MLLILLRMCGQGQRWCLEVYLLSIKCAIRMYGVSQLSLSYDQNKKRKEPEFSSQNICVLLIQKQLKFGVITLSNEIRFEENMLQKLV